MTKLTGRIRYRYQERWFKPPLLVLQVEEQYNDGPPNGYGLPTHLAGIHWRDARIEDLSCGLRLVEARK